MPRPQTNPLLRLSLIVALITFVLYATTMPTTNVGYADSDELITVGHNLGAAHPPGYPLYMLLVYVATHLPIAISIAAKAHLLSAFLSALTVGLVFATTWKAHEIIAGGKKDFYIINQNVERIWISLIAAGTLAGSSLFWLYGQIAEKFALLNLLTAATFFFLTLWYSAAKQKRYLYLLLAAISMGLAISHHQTALVLIVPAAVLLWFNQKSLPKKLELQAIPLVLLTASAALPFALLLLYQRANPAVSWAFTPNLDGLYAMVSRQDFIGQVFERGQQQNSFLPKIDINGSLNAVFAYITHTLTYFGIWFAIPVVLAGFFGHRQHKTLFYFLGSGVLAVSLGLAGYLQWPADLGSQAITQRQYLMGYIPLVLFAIFGWLLIARRLGGAINVLFGKEIAHVSVITLTILLVAGKIISTYPEVSLRSFTVTHMQYSQMLNKFAQNSVVTCFSDVSCFALLLEQKVNNVRPDVTIIPTAYPLVTETINQPDLKGFNYPDNPYLLLDIITWNLDKRPVYAVDLSSFYFNFLGLDNGIIYYIPQGDYGQFSRQIPKEIAAYSLPATKVWLSTQTPDWDLMRLYLKDNYARNAIINSYIYLKMGLRPLAQDELNTASNMYFQMRPEDQSNIIRLRAQIEQTTAVAKYQPGSHVSSAKEYLGFIPELLKVNKNGQALMAARAASMVEPTSVEAHLMLADMYEKMGDFRFALLEYANVLKLDPANSQAKDRLAAVERLR